MSVRWISIGVTILVVWIATTFAVAFAVVEWRKDSDPSFYCREATRAYLDAFVQPDTETATKQAVLDYLYDVRLTTCGLEGNSKDLSQ